MTLTRALLRRVALKLARLLYSKPVDLYASVEAGHSEARMRLACRFDRWRAYLANPFYAYASRPVEVTLRDGSKWVAHPTSRLQFYPKHIPGTANLREQKNPHARHTGLDFGPDWRVDADGYPAAKWRS